MFFKGKAAALLAASALALVVPAAISAVPAQASVRAQAFAPAQASDASALIALPRAPQLAIPAAYGAIQCSGDVCIQSHCAHCLEQPIAVWANTYTFTGHFEVTFGCTIGGCTVFNSPNRTWRAGGTAWISPVVPSAANSANAYGWKGGPPWTQIGDVGFYLDL